MITRLPLFAAMMLTGVQLASCATVETSSVRASAQPLPVPEADPSCASNAIDVPQRADVQPRFVQVAEPLRACVAARQQRNLLFAELVFSCRGAVTSARIESGSSAEPWWTEAEEQCLLNTLRSVTLPAFRGRVYRIRYPFAL
jgi:hypothetical protein